MTAYGKKKMEKDNRIIVFFIELKVYIGLLLFKKVQIEYEAEDINKSMERQIKKWCNIYKIIFKVEIVEHPIYAIGHGAYKLNYTKKYKLMSFSK